MEPTRSRLRTILLCGSTTRALARLTAPQLMCLRRTEQERNRGPFQVRTSLRLDTTIWQRREASASQRPALKVEGRLCWIPAMGRWHKRGMRFRGGALTSSTRQTIRATAWMCERMEQLLAPWCRPLAVTPAIMSSGQLTNINVGRGDAGRTAAGDIVCLAGSHT